MTDERARELIAVVKGAFLPQVRSHPEADELLGEGILAAYEALEKLPADCPYSWTTIAVRAARWRAWGYLKKRRSLVSLEDLEEKDSAALGVEGGFGAADARLQLSLWAPELTAKQRQALELIYREGRSESEAARLLGCARQTLRYHFAAALTAYRRAGGVAPGNSPGDCRLRGTDRCRRCRRPVPASRGRAACFCSDRCKWQAADSRRASGGKRQAAKRRAERGVK